MTAHASKQRFQSPMRGVNRWLLIYVTITMLTVTAKTSPAQEIGGAISDFTTAPYRYSPSDPWKRSRLFQAHTGHDGHFYNCDNEECQRYSPYVYWQEFCGPQLPPRRGLWGGLKIDLAKVRQRIHDGAGDCTPPSESRNQSRTGTGCQTNERTATQLAIAPATAAATPESPSRDAFDDARCGLLRSSLNNSPTFTTRPSPDLVTHPGRTAGLPPTAQTR